MLQNYIKIAFRNLWRSPLYSVLTIGGLSLGIACCLLIALYVYDERSYDRFHPNAATIYRITEKQKQPEGVFDVAVTPGPLAASLKKDFPEVVETARIGQWNGQLKVGKQVYEEKQMFFTDNGLFKLFDFPLVKGDWRTALTKPYEVVLTETTARKYFGANWLANPAVLGARLRLNNDKDYTVVGVAKDAPGNSHLQFGVLLSFKSLELFDEWSIKWSGNSFHTYLQLRDGTDVAAFAGKIKNQCIRYNPNTENTLQLQPLTAIYLYSDFAFNTDWGVRGSIFHVNLFTLVGLIVLLIACMNFINLATARSARRSREVGVRKTVGARRQHLVFQFLGESFLLTIVAVLVAMLLAGMLMPLFNQLSGKQVSLNYGSLPIWLALGTLTLGVGLLAGLYPAVLLSGFQPAKVLTGVGINNLSGRGFRQSLVVGQFVMSLVLIISTVFVYNQLRFMQTKNLGFDKAQLMYVRMGGDLRQKAGELKQDLLRQPSVELATTTTARMIDIANESNISWPGKQPNDDFLITNINVDADFLATVGMKLASGSNFRPKAKADTTTTFLVNETAARRMGYTAQTALNKQVEFWGKKGLISGVVQDFHFRPLNVPIAPMILRYEPSNPYFNMLVKIRPGQAQLAIQRIGELYKQYEKETPLEYGFVDQELDNQYRREERTGQVMGYFSVLAILISCLGLFGLAAFTAEQRTKEVGVRKVLGASVASIVTLLSKDFLKLVIIAIVIASPIAWYAMTQWLADFAYKIDIEWWVFALSGTLAIVIALLTVSFQSLKAALVNPVKSLRSE
ncbi:ABC transporter permease [Fibrella aquatica]|uniref:ABC transporter permease n=1 Tax=Fibrella aquatica TaxID=3242487 RepID=UPI0035202EFE